MKVYVINGKKVIGALRFLLVIAAAALALVLIFNIGSRVIEAANYSETSADVGRVIIIDPGHGGEDPGAVGADGVYEKDLNLSISFMLCEELTSRGYTVVMTRTEDRMLYSEEENIKGMRKLSDLKNRCKITEEYDDAILISVHMNSFGDSKYSGLQVYYTDGDSSSMSLANKIQSSVKNELQPDNNRTVKNGKNLYLLENSSATSVLIECGFLTNLEECENLSKKEYQKQLSFGIVCGIIEYINGLDAAS